MRTAIYARYSSDNQREASIEDQVRICRARIEQESWTLAGTYTDHAISGATTLRPGYQKLLEDARANAFEIVLAEGLDRLSRDQENIAGLFKQLSFSGIKLVTLAEGEISELHVGLKGTMNALYLKDLAQKTRRGLEGRVRAGRSAGGIVYGYDIVRELDPSGEPIRGGRKINEAAAVVVRRIFTEFANGKSPAAIARQLNAESISGSNGRPWQGGTISGHSRRRTGILRNETYVGRLVWNRQHFVKDPASGKRVARLNPESQWIVHEIPELRIVDDELWRKVAERLEDREASPRARKVRASRFWEKRRPGYLLTGLIRCGRCGGRFTSVGGDYLACAAARKMGTCDNRRGVPRPLLEDFIFETLKQHLMHPDLVKEFIAEFHAEVNRQNRDHQLTLENKKRDLAEVTRRHSGLIDAIADGLRTPGLKEQLERLEHRKTELAQAIAQAPPTAPQLHPNLAELYRRKVAELQRALEDPSLRNEALTILRSLIDHVVITPADSGFEVDFVGEIANMIKVPGGQDAQNLGHYAISVKRVAGARNQRYLHLAKGWIPRIAG
jgi:DNA invertase Pin-like site-specific DNA recombinase